ncbi:TatD family hydrolase [Rhodoplanes sp. TEM]|uniref:TatD family hydrolase n=1 Tax=Rhodoplanes tepidamans TaxID=200616 RepID=A0ABT5JL21_RHOTP|nr:MULTISPECIES: Qat anti-phage system TatD family nuclease QatD [Rhodoplanes]MDC7789936.1 TatD family hydrolase [Rhodoplanes tepidamans]MDC7987851.1 TatD family hydrolase [Rhodoplanes sp. TEM]MDQ0357850.1 TatD DNase family protein [Rhodoplanes tepidamans]
MHSGLVDFHCHLDLYSDHAAAVEQCEREGIFTLTVTTTPKAWLRNNELATRTRHVRAALGLHPQLVAERAHEIDLWEKLLPQSRYVGEVGLDASPRFYRSFENQKQIFARVLSLCAAAGNKIVTVHSVRATKAVLDMIEQQMPPSCGRVVLHWFTGTASEAKRAVDLGCYFSVNTEMLVNTRRAAITKTLPLDRVLTETDGPFTQVGFRPARPSDVLLAVEGLARLHNLTRNDMCAVILRNLRNLCTDSE